MHSVDLNLYRHFIQIILLAEFVAVNRQLHPQIPATRLVETNMKGHIMKQKKKKKVCFQLVVS